MDMEKINENPVRVLLTQTEKKGLFSKKEVPVYAIGDENGTPLTEYEFSSIKPFEDGFAVALRKKADAFFWIQTARKFFLTTVITTFV